LLHYCRSVFFLSGFILQRGKSAIIVWNVCNTLLACDDYIFRQTMQFKIFVVSRVLFLIQFVRLLALRFPSLSLPLFSTVYFHSHGSKLSWEMVEIKVPIFQ
ncbi:Uncharacterized protein APZ42_000113, partial [Daphnia magna]